MRHSLIAKLVGLLLLYPLLPSPGLSKNLDNQSLGNQLEEFLNQNEYDLLKNLFLQKSLKKFDKQYLDYTKKYKDSKWSINTINNDHNKTLLDIRVTSIRKISNQIYNINSKQIIEIETFKNKIKSYKILNSESTLNSQNSPLVVKIISPEKVLTGERYEINLIIEKPLDNSFIASGMIVLKNKDKINLSSYKFGIKPNQSGGLFKYIQAPLDPGFQTISAIITHPEGIYSITKRIKVGL